MKKTTLYYFETVEKTTAAAASEYVQQTDIHRESKKETP